MGRMVLTCFHQLLLIKENPPSSPADFDVSLRLFSSLLVDIQRLEASLEDRSLSLQWCSGAANLLKKMHLQFLSFVESFKSSAEPFVLWDGVEVDCYIDEYMKESLNLLDFCNLLKSAISGMNRYRLLIDFAAEKLGEDPSLSDSTTAEIERLEAETFMQLKGKQNWKVFDKMFNACTMGRAKNGNNNSTVGFICALKGTMGLICMIIFRAIFHPISIKAEDELFIEFPQLNLFSVSLNKLVFCFSKGLEGVQDSSMQVLVEKRMVERAISDIKVEASRRKDMDAKKIMMGIDLLRKKVAALNDGLEMFQAEVTELFEDVVKGRNKLLGMVKAAY